MSNPLLLIGIVSSPTENCLNIVSAEAECDRKLFFQPIRRSVCGDTPAILIWDEVSQMFGIFRFHPWSWMTNRWLFCIFFFFFFRKGLGTSVSRGHSATLVFESQKKNNHPLGRWVRQQGGNQTTDMGKLLPWRPCGCTSGQHRRGKITPYQSPGVKTGRNIV